MKIMLDYQRMYTNLFNAMTKAIGILQEAQLLTEEIYCSDEDDVEE